MVYSLTFACLTALAIVAVASQLHAKYYVLKYAGFSASEYAKAHVYVADLTGCMMAIVLTAHLNPRFSLQTPLYTLCMAVQQLVLALSFC